MHWSPYWAGVGSGTRVGHVGVELVLQDDGSGFAVDPSTIRVPLISVGGPPDRPRGIGPRRSSARWLLSRSSRNRYGGGRVELLGQARLHVRHHRASGPPGYPPDRPPRRASRQTSSITSWARISSISAVASASGAWRGTVVPAGGPKCVDVRDRDADASLADVQPEDRAHGPLGLAEGRRWARGAGRRCAGCAARGRTGDLDVDARVERRDGRHPVRPEVQLARAVPIEDAPGLRLGLAEDRRLDRDGIEELDLLRGRDDRERDRRTTHHRVIHGRPRGSPRTADSPSGRCR